MLPTNLKNIFETYEIVPMDILILGVSGGVDSMVLLEALTKMHPPSQIIACHIDHGMRAESAGDADFVKEVCSKYGIACEAVRIDIVGVAEGKKMSIESAGRMVRYEFFEKVRAVYRGRFILTAHHLDDSVETVILNFIRGSRLRGLSGIRERQGVLLRPLLTLKKSEIREYAESVGIGFREDSSNEDSKYLRNRIRNEILPQMEQINPSVRDTIADFAVYAKELDAMMEGLL